MIMPIVWIKQLPREWKAIFEKIALEEHEDSGHGAGARMVDRVLRQYLEEREKVVE